MLIQVDSLFFNQSLQNYMILGNKRDLSNKLVSLFCVKDSKTPEEPCDHRVLKYVLEQATKLRELIILENITDADLAFIDVKIKAPLEWLQIKDITDASIDGICQLASSLKTLCFEDCEQITNDGKQMNC